MDGYFDWAEKYLVNFTLAKSNDFVLSSKIENIVSYFQMQHNMSYQQAYNEFLGIWANNTEFPKQYPEIDWTGLLVSLNQKTASNIPLDLASNLLGQSDPLALRNGSMSSWSPWGWVLNGNSTYFDSIAQNFALSNVIFLIFFFFFKFII